MEQNKQKDEWMNLMPVLMQVLSSIIFVLALCACIYMSSRRYIDYITIISILISSFSLSAILTCLSIVTKAAIRYLENNNSNNV